ncbi:hypothetical protein J2S43_004991 [Catenuloplanes nepalensis]|uniref:F5/8 type C domain-containing protein n=1 Tax=Catenuloplanes nepalensis TaxID=587533 RepID=A0ABT9MYF4_9ACTN|nr:DUF1996 domain-containing protein [Catenuloplanes nepalensis]MDP9796479.1 hypothetical protein [Catenuloplanes nepalensis]
MKRLITLGVALLGLLGTYLIVTTATASAAEALLSQGRTAAASSSESSAFPAGAAVDGNAGTRWSSAAADPQWLRVDLGTSATITRVALNWEAAYARGFQLQTSADGNAWTTVHTATNATGGNQSITINGTGRYVRVYTTARGTAYGVSLWEFEVFGAGGAPATSLPPNVVRVAEFLADCPYSHRLPDDPIIFPGLPGASHMHSFFGATVTNAMTNLADLLNSQTTCNPREDKSSYWVPTLYQDNVPVEPTGVTFYYLGEGVRDDIIANTQPIPLGLRIVAGNARATGPNDNTISRWSCLHAGHVGSSHDFVNCPSGTMLESYLDFPQCWNGRDLDSADHKSHMAYPVNQACPATHPVAVPKLRQVLRYPVSGDPARLRLASGGGFTMHGDFFNAWPEAEMARRVNDCIRPIIKCGANGRP